MIIADFFIIVCGGSILRYSRYLIYKYLWKTIGISEFNISRGCIGLIFNQTLLWIGIFFSPPLAAVIVLKMMVTFYLKVCCHKLPKSYRTSQNKQFQYFAESDINQLLQTTIKTLAIISNLYTVFVNALCIAHDRHRYFRLRSNSVSYSSIDLMISLLFLILN